MKKHGFFKKTISMLLALVMVFLMIPFSAIVTSAAGSTDDYAPLSTGHKILSTYNALSGTDISSYKADLHSSLEIFDSTALSSLLKDFPYMDMYGQVGEEHRGTDMKAFAVSAGASLTQSIGGSIGVEKLFKVSASQKFNLSGEFSYKKAVETYFYEYVVKIQQGYYSFDENKLDLVRNNPTAYLNGSFYNSLLNDSPDVFFEKYGTHIITRYTTGGVAGVYSSSVKTDENVEISLSGEYTKDAGAEGTYKGVDGGINSALNIKMNVEGSAEEKGYTTSADVYAYGGDAYLGYKFGDTPEFQKWADSITAENGTILVDERLRFVPIWELLPDGEYEAREIQLKQYFITKSESLDEVFYNLYFEENDRTFDYSKDWLNFDNAKIITDEEGLNDIRNDLRGVYVLANDIVLSKYADWEPIGTKEKPFEGRLYGNMNTISGVNITQTDISMSNPEDTVIGLFGYNSGLITDVGIDGSFTVTNIAKPNVYIGGIAAYNHGVVNNCNDEIEYNIKYGLSRQICEDLGLSFSKRKVEEITYTISEEEKGICLSGGGLSITSFNCEIIIEESSNTDPVYIYLEDVVISMLSATNGFIYNKSERPVYVFCEGQVLLNGRKAGSPIINCPQSEVFIFGNLAKLLAKAGVGKTAEKSGEDGGRGGDAIIAKEVTIGGIELEIIGGNGGEPFSFLSNCGDGGYAINSEKITLIHASGVLQGGDGGYCLNGIQIISGRGSLATATPPIVKGWITLVNGSHAIEGTPDGSPKIERVTKEKRYLVYDHKELWADAARKAHAMGGYLATITDMNEQEYIKKFLDYATWDEYYLGAQRLEGEWKWGTNEVFEYTNWRSGEPNNAGGKENYLGVYKESMEWNDFPDSERGYIVEKDIFESVVGFSTPEGKNIAGTEWDHNLLKIQQVTKTEYYSTNKLFETVFDTTTVTVSYEAIGDGSLVEFSGSLGTPGISAITVKYKDYERLIPIQIIQTKPEKIEIATTPKTEYEIWDEFDVSDQLLRVSYNDGSIRENVPFSDRDVNCTEPDMNTLGEKTVTVQYWGAETSYIITVSPKSVTGHVDIYGQPYVGSTLTGHIASISDKDAENSCSYAWFVDGMEQETMGETFLVRESMVDKTITLKVIFYGNYQGTLENTKNIDKKDQAAPEETPTVSAKTDTSVTLTELSGMEYTYCIGNAFQPSDDAIWSYSGTFEGLIPNTTYSFFMRKAETSTSNASASSGATVVKTLKTTVIGTVAVQGGNKIGETLTADISNITTNATITYQWYRNGVAIASATASSYTLTDADDDAEIYLIVSGSNSFTGNIQSNIIKVRSSVVTPDTPQIVVDSKTATAGGKVQISVNLANNPGVVSMYLNLNYDTDVLELLSVEDEGLLKGKTFGQTLTSPYAITWDDSTASANNTDNGKLVTFTFQVKEGAELGTTTVSITYNAGDIIDFDLLNVEFATVDGIVSIVDYVPGDVNMDGEVNAVDVAFVRRHLAGWEDYKVISTDAADVNKDGTVNATDVALLRRYLAKWDGIVLQ